MLSISTLTYGSACDSKAGKNMDIADGKDMVLENKQYYKQEDIISKVIQDSDFHGFGNLIFPIHRSYWSGRTLANLQLT